MNWLNGWKERKKNSNVADMQKEKRQRHMAGRPSIEKSGSPEMIMMKALPLSPFITFKEYYSIV